MTLLRAYHLPDTGEQLSCYIAPSGTVKMKLAGHGYDFIVGIGKAGHTHPLETDQGTIEVDFNQEAGNFIDAVYQTHVEGQSAKGTILEIINGRPLHPRLQDLTGGWVLPVK